MTEDFRTSLIYNSLYYSFYFLYSFYPEALCDRNLKYGYIP